MSKISYANGVCVKIIVRAKLERDFLYTEDKN